ncbi:hypothetical protein [Vibrio sp. WXL103]|uniref:hypothetical protein n=1 Tax=Vibrio sp. WXL103 TaxID=3450710 RepID=UPI003EC87CFD
MIVINISDETVTDTARNNWLKYWQHFSDEEYHFCSEANCTAKHQHGVLVKRKLPDNQNRLLVVPLCKEHSYGFKSQLELDERVPVVHADMSL